MSSEDEAKARWINDVRKSWWRSSSSPPQIWKTRARRPVSIADPSSDPTDWEVLAAKDQGGCRRRRVDEELHQRHAERVVQAVENVRGTRTGSRRGGGMLGIADERLPCSTVDAKRAEGAAPPLGISTKLGADADGDSSGGRRTRRMRRSDVRLDRNGPW
jgi:hypothetical protein